MQQLRNAPTATLPWWFCNVAHCTASTCSGRVHSLTWRVAMHFSQITLGRTCYI